MDLLSGSFSFASGAPKLKTNKICLFDADFLKYMATYLVNENRKKIAANLPDAITNFEFESEPIYFLKSYLSTNFFNKIEDTIIFCFSGASSKTFRNAIAFDKQYKGKRTKEELYPGQFEHQVLVFEYMIKNFNHLYFEDLEADDIVSALHDSNTYILSKDKDLKQLAGFHYDFDTNSIYELSPKDAGFNLCRQLIQGDSTDNIGGIPLMGEKKATEFLLSYQPNQWLIRVLELYMIKLGKLNGVDAFCENWMLIKTRINRGQYFQEKYQKMFNLKNQLLGLK